MIPATLKQLSELDLSDVKLFDLAQPDSKRTDLVNLLIEQVFEIDMSCNYGISEQSKLFKLFFNLLFNESNNYALAEYVGHADKDSGKGGWATIVINQTIQLEWGGKWGSFQSLKLIKPINFTIQFS